MPIKPVIVFVISLIFIVFLKNCTYEFQILFNKKDAFKEDELKTR